MLKNFDPVLDSVTCQGDRSSKNKEFVDRVTEKNVHDTVANIKDKSSVLNSLFESGEIDIVGAIYDVGSGKVVFFKIINTLYLVVINMGFLPRNYLVDYSEQPHR